ncbi:STAS domain-containing protein [Spirochaeta dissipatitropha]
MKTEIIRTCIVLEPEERQIDSSIASGFARALLSALNDAMEQNPGAPVVLDLASTEFIDSSGLSRILDALRLCHARNILFYISAPHSAVATLFRMVRLNQLTKVFNSREQAIDALDTR